LGIKLIRYDLLGANTNDQHFYAVKKKKSNSCIIFWHWTPSTIFASRIIIRWQNYLIELWYSPVEKQAPPRLRLIVGSLFLAHSAKLILYPYQKEHLNLYFM